MTRICSFVLGAVTTLTLSACGSDDSAGTHGSGGSSATGTGGGGTSTGGAGTGTGTGGSATGTGGSSTVGTGGSGTSKGGGTSTGGSATATGGASATGGNATNCQATCQKLKAANCGDFTTTDCSQPCGSAGICQSEADTFYTCASSTGTVSCDMTDAVVAGCDASSRAFNVCAVCLPQNGDTACDTCTGTSCCTELRGYVSTADVNAFYGCISAATCTTQACVDTCVGMYPTAGKAYNDAVGCQTKSCATPCICGADATDAACPACLKANCCDQVVPYVTASDFAAFSACLAPCADVACLDDCVAKSPIAGAAYTALSSNCVDTTCAAECAGP